MVIETGSFVDKVEQLVQQKLDGRQAEAEQRFDQIIDDFIRSKQIVDQYDVKKQFKRVASILTERLGYVCDVQEAEEPKLDLSDPIKPKIQGECTRYSLSLRWHDPEKNKSWDISVISCDGRIEVLSILNQVEELPEDTSVELINSALSSAFNHPREIGNDWVTGLARK